MVKFNKQKLKFVGNSRGFIVPDYIFKSGMVDPNKPVRITIINVPDEDADTEIYSRDHSQVRLNDFTIYS